MFLIITASGSASSGRYRDTGPLTVAQLILIAVVAVLVVLAILWGIRLKRLRSNAEQAELERSEELKAHPQTETSVFPAPPPLADAEVVSEPSAQPAPKRAAPAKKAAPKPTAAAAPRPAGEKSATKAPAKAKPAGEQPAAKTPAKTKPAAPAAAGGYQLIDVKGLGPKAVPLLEGLGITDLAALAALSPARAAEIDAQLGVLSGRMARDRWVEQAKLLTAGDVASFEATYGKL